MDGPNRMKIAQITDLHLRYHLPGTSAVRNRQSRFMSGLLAQSLEYLRQEQINLVVLSGDLVDAPDDESVDPAKLPALVLREYQHFKEILETSGLPYHCMPGNHDDLGLFFTVFGRQPEFEIKDHFFCTFYDHQHEGIPIFRENEQWQQFEKVIAQPGPRNQIHLQHYLIRPEYNDGWPHTYANAGEISTLLEKSQRVLLTLSGHYHKGANLSCEGVRYHTAKSFCDPPCHFYVIEIREGKVQIVERDMAVTAQPIPLESPAG